MVRNAVSVFALLQFLRLFALSVECSPIRYEFRQMHMGTLFRIVLYSSDASLAQEAARRAFFRIEQLEKVLSNYREDSELRRVETHAFENPQVLSHDLYAVSSRRRRSKPNISSRID